MEKTAKYDVVVIGAGPSGLMAAICAAQNNAKVLVVEKNSEAGKKLLFTGGGRCNFTNYELDLRRLISHYGKNGAFLFHSFSIFGPKEAVSFFERLGVKTKIEEHNRVFPKSNKSREIVDVLISMANKLNIEFKFSNTVYGIEKRGGKITSIAVGDNKIFAKHYIICTGGKAYPQTGSAGDGLLWLKKLGHTVVESKPALVPVTLSDDWVKDLSGVVLRDCRLMLLSGKKTLKKSQGELLFTHFGISGPMILDMSRDIIDAMAKGKATLILDCLPRYDQAGLDRELIIIFSKNANATLKNCLSGVFPKNFGIIISMLCNIDSNRLASSITREERHSLVQKIKRLELNPSGTLGFGEALATSGGVALGEVDDKTMRSKIIKNLSFAGEILDLTGDTGGFNLQMCWSTGYLAGKNVA